MARTLSKSNVSCCGIHCRSSPGCICNKVSVSKSNREGDGGGEGGRCNYVYASVAGTRRAMHRPMRIINKKEGAEAIAFKCHSHSVRMLRMLHTSALHLPLLRSRESRRCPLLDDDRKIIREILNGRPRGGRLVCRTDIQYHTSTGPVSRD